MKSKNMQTQKAEPIVNKEHYTISAENLDQISHPNSITVVAAGEYELSIDFRKN